MHLNDPQGTIKEQAKPDVFEPTTPNGYVTTAEGEPLPLTQPSEENHIRFHGGFLEDKELNTSAGSNRGYLYRMGVRHYSPALGRFLQRDPVGNFRPPNPEYPLASNPYAYGLNQPLEFTDTSGRQACPVPGAGDFLGRGEMDAPDSGGGDEACLKPWLEEYRDCINATCWVCCVQREQPGGICDPCAQVGCIPAVGKHSWEQCCEWCCGTGDENAPANYGGISISGMPAGPYGPPWFGAGGIGGKIWGIFPLPLPALAGNPDRIPPIPMLTESVSAGGSTAESNIWRAMPHMRLSFLKTDPGVAQMSLGAWGVAMTGAAFLVDFLVGEYCSNVLSAALTNPCDAVQRCKAKACCNWQRCVRWGSALGVLRGVHLGVLHARATLGGWGAFASGFGFVFGLFKLTVTSVCSLLLWYFVRQCEELQDV